MLDSIEVQVHSGRRLGGRTLLDTAPLLAQLAQARELLIAELRESAALLTERDAMVAAGRREIDQLRSERDADLAEERLVRSGAANPTEESAQILAEASEFAERSLAELEAVLQRVLFTITRARTALDEDGSVLGARGLQRSLGAPPEPA